MRSKSSNPPSSNRERPLYSPGHRHPNIDRGTVPVPVPVPNGFRRKFPGCSIYINEILRHNVVANT